MESRALSEGWSPQFSSQFSHLKGLNESPLYTKFTSSVKMGVIISSLLPRIVVKVKQDGEFENILQTSKHYGNDYN